MTVAVDRGVRELLPDVAVEFLRELVRQNPGIRVIRLTPVRLSAGAVQEIVCESACGGDRRRVFGFPPVGAQLAVEPGDGGVWMRLSA